MNNIELGITKKDSDKIFGVIKSLLPKCSIWIYGSRARGDFNEKSDLDLAIDCKKPLDILELGELNDVLNSLRTDVDINIVDLNSISDENFLNEIKKDLKLWKK